jgi:hypothetical protein
MALALKLVEIILILLCVSLIGCFFMWLALVGIVDDWRRFLMWPPKDDR